MYVIATSLTLMGPDQKHSGLSTIPGPEVIFSKCSTSTSSIYSSVSFLEGFWKTILCKPDHKCLFME